MSNRYMTGREAVVAGRSTSGFDTGDFRFFNLKDGETIYLRFLHGIEDMTIYSHACAEGNGVQNWEVGASRLQEHAETGTPLVCPGCNVELTDNDVVGHRPGFIGVGTHYADCSDGKKRTFVCLEKFVDPETGQELACPICSHMKADGKQTYPRRMRFYGAAVVRNTMFEQAIGDAGIPIQQLQSIEDNFFTPEGETEARLDVILISQAWSNFWGKLDSVHTNDGAIGYFDFAVTRQGTKTDTSYIIEKVGAANPIPFEGYKEFVPDIMQYLDNSIGNPEYYVKMGWGVPGYTPKQQETQPQAQAPAPQGQNPLQGQAPVQQQPQAPVPGTPGVVGTQFAEVASAMQQPQAPVPPAPQQEPVPQAPPAPPVQQPVAPQTPDSGLSQYNK